eukprot:Rhum_TRINITY_DN14805_c16_g1::Rhum_TRINITY_DN14805_c16_g1_i1::g.121494::m.121494
MRGFVLVLIHFWLLLSHAACKRGPGIARVDKDGVNDHDNAKDHRVGDGVPEQEHRRRGREHNGRTDRHILGHGIGVLDHSATQQSAEGVDHDADPRRRRVTVEEALLVDHLAVTGGHHQRGVPAEDGVERKLQVARPQAHLHLLQDLLKVHTRQRRGDRGGVDQHQAHKALAASCHSHSRRLRAGSAPEVHQRDTRREHGDGGPLRARQLTLEEQHREHTRPQRLALVRHRVRGSVENGDSHELNVVLEEVQKRRYGRLQRFDRLVPGGVQGAVGGEQDGDARQHFERFLHDDSGQGAKLRLTRQRTHATHQEHGRRVLGGEEREDKVADGDAVQLRHVWLGADRRCSSLNRWACWGHDVHSDGGGRVPANTPLGHCSFFFFFPRSTCVGTMKYRYCSFYNRWEVKGWK